MAEIRRIIVQGQPGQKVQKITISKITRAKWTGECLLCKRKAEFKHQSHQKKKLKNKKLGNSMEVTFLIV
jgi:hypothetical protein